MVKNRKGLSGVEGGKVICYQWKKGSVRKETNAVTGMRLTIVHKNHPSHPFHKVEVCRRREVSKAKRPSLGKIQVKISHQRSPYAAKFESPYALKFEDRSQEENSRQQRCAQSKAWNLSENICKLKENDKTTFCSPVEEWVLLAASTEEPEEREFVVDSGASMHMVIKRVRNSAELEIMRTSRSPTAVMAVNGEVQTRKEATVDVKEWDLFATVMLREETPEVLSLETLCQDHEYTCHWTSGQKPHLTKKYKIIDCNISNNVPFVVPGLSTNSFLFNAHTYFIIFSTGFRI